MEQKSNRQTTIRCIYAVYFSPTGNTKFLAETLADQIAAEWNVPCESIDVTLPQGHAGGKQYVFQKGDLVVFGMPTYAGKLPNKILPFVREGFIGGGAAAAALVTFGNRRFDNSLAELCECLRVNGFLTVGAGAFAALHAFAWDDKAPAFRRNRISAVENEDNMQQNGFPGQGRPDGRDLEMLADFGSALIHKAEYLKREEDPLTVPGDAAAPYYTPLGLDGRPVQFLKAKPKTDPSECTGCGICALHCPMGSIAVEADGEEKLPEVTGICIKCHACVKNCPAGAMYFDDPAYLSHRNMLKRDYRARQEPVWFV